MIEVMPRREPELLSWKEAKKGIGNGWRLPTIDEMQSIYKSKLVYQLCSPKFEDIYLTSTPTFNNRMVRVFSTINGSVGSQRRKGEDSMNIGACIARMYEIKKEKADLN